jgi:HD-GYP domain-containing protein (c-di-GMP phosphodiesterase class II)
MTEVKTPVSDLKIGMYVSRLDKDWTESSFLLQGLLIETEEDIKQLTAECSYVYVEGAEAKTEAVPKETTVKTVAEPSKKANFSFSALLGKKEEAEEIIDIAPPPELNREQTNQLNDILEHKIAPETIKPPKKIASFSHEMGVAKLILNKIGILLKKIMGDIKTGKGIDEAAVADAEKITHHCMASVLRSPDAMLLAITQEEKQHTLWQQGMNVSVLAISLGRHLNLADEELVTLGLCGMFHDMGMLLISKDDLEKTSDRRELIHSHTLLGGDFLSKCPGQLSHAVAKVAYSHHENLDGSGFPLGLADKDITSYTRIISIASLYNTLTTDTPSRKALSHYAAMAELFKEAEKKHLDKTLVNSFNQCIGTYPIGCYVEMNTGEIGVVVEANIEQRLKPIIMLLTTPDKKERPRQLINLAKASFDGKVNTYSIKSIVNPEHYAIEL